MIAQRGVELALLAGLSEGQRSIAHLVILLALAGVAGLVLLIRKVRRPDQTRDAQRSPEEED